MAKSIVTIEPQCRGFAHSTFNAAFLDCVISTYPAADITFMAEPDHLRLVQSAFLKYAVHKDTLLHWIQTDIPKRLRLSRLPLIYLYMRRILNQVLISKPDLLFFTSISAEELSCLKKLMGKRPSYPPVFVLMHGNLNAIYNTYSGKPWKSILTLRKALQMPDPEALYYLVLGESIIQTIREIPFLDSHKFQSMDIPYLWFNNKVTHKPNPNKLHFGLLGVASKGLKEFSEIATRFKNEYPESKWSVVGYCNPRTLEKFTPPSFIQIHTQPLSLEEYIQYANQLDYILWIPHNPDDYKLSASATFLDALSLVKPGIYLSNRYIDYYFQKMGDIGYSAKDREELVQITHSLLSDFSHERYQAQLDTILRQRTLFDIATTSSQLREITKLSS